MKESVKPGDWVRFYYGGRLVLAEVHYIRSRSSWESYDKAATELCEVPLDRILEVRSKPEDR